METEDVSDEGEEKMEVSSPPEMKPRPYQESIDNFNVELYRKAVERDAIIYLGTGSGKTFIAVMMIREYLPAVLSSEKKIVFLVNTVILAHQQCAFINKHIPATAKSFCGEDGVDDWDAARWTLEQESCEIMVMIGAVFRDALIKRFMHEEKICLLILDECHHSKKNSPYAQILKVINNAEWTKRPRVLGLSASLVNSKSNTNEKFLKELHDLEFLMKCKAVTTDENLASYLEKVNSPTEICEHYTHFSMEPELVNIFDLLEKEAYSVAVPRKDNKKPKIVKTLGRMQNLIQNLGLHAIEVIQRNDELDLFEEEIDDTSTPEELEIRKKVLDMLKVYYSSRRNAVPSFNISCGYSEKVRWLFEIVSNYFENLQDTGFKKLPSAIVFVKERATAKALEIYLQVNFPKFRIGSIVGSAGRPLPLISQFSYAKSKQKEMMSEFRVGKTAVIVATSVLEEGVDVQTCDLVVRFDKIETFQSYVQSKGRARAKDSKFVMMVDIRETKIWEEDYNKYRELESKGMALVHGSHQMPDSGEDFRDLISPYYSQPELGINSPCLTKFEAISLVHRYVDMIPSDRFTTLEVDYEFEYLVLGDTKKCKCKLTLPHRSIHRDTIEGSFFFSKKTAKQDAAMEACKILHQKGILNHRFQLVRPVKLLGLNVYNEDDGKGPKHGTKRCRRFYPVTLPPELRNLKVEKTRDGFVLASGDLFHVYRLSLVSIERSHAPRYKTYNPEETPSKLAIISAQPLPQAAFEETTLYPKSGAVLAKFQFLGCLKIIPTHVYEISLTFQAKVIPFILQSSLPWTAVDETSENYLISIVTNDCKFDVELLKTCLGESKSFEDFDNNLEVLDNAVLHPIHVQTDMNYFVENIFESETIESLIPSKGISYKTYFQTIYNFHLKSPNQPIFSVSSANKEHFMLHKVPNFVRGKDNRRPRYPSEAVEVLPVPASLWREVQILPFAMRVALSRIFISKIRMEILGKTPFSESNSQIRPNLFTTLIQKHQDVMTLPGIDDLAVALTLQGANLENNLERLEVIGDSFLKFIVSVGLYFNKSIDTHLFNEGILTMTRSEIIGNRKLRNLMVQRGFVDLLVPEMYEPRRLWLSPCLKQLENVEKRLCELDVEFRHKHDTGENSKRKKLPNATIFSYVTSNEIDNFRTGSLSPAELLKIARDRHQNNDTLVRVGPRENVLISDKSIADAAEALIGLILTCNGHHGALEFMHWLGIDLSPKLTFDELVKGHCLQPPNFDWYLNINENDEQDPKILQKSDVVEFHLKKANARSVEQALNYTFKNRSLLLQSLTHGSYSSNKITLSYESLEFLGDAVMDYLVSAHFYSESEQKSPGELTEMRSLVVCNNTLALICVKNSLHKNLLHHCPLLLGQIEGYLNNFESSSEEIETERKALNTNMALINEEDGGILEGVDIPKVLGDIVESLIGAVFLDSGGCLLTSWRAIQSLFKIDLRELVKSTQPSPVKKVLEKFPEKITFEKRLPKKGKSVCCAVLKLNPGEEPREFFGYGKNNKIAKSAAARCVLRATA